MRGHVLLCRFRHISFRLRLARQITIPVPASTRPSKIVMPELPKSSGPLVSIEDAPRDEQLVQHDGKTYTTVKEGSAYILVPPDAPQLLDPKTYGTEPPQSVFYNPIQQYNRDLTVLVIRAFGEDFLEREAARKSQSFKKNRSKRKVKEQDLQPHSNGQAKEKKDAEIQEDTTSQEVETSKTAGDSESRPKLKRESEHGLETTKKRRTSVAEADDFEDGGINDEDLLQVEDALGLNGSASSASEIAKPLSTREQEPSESTKTQLPKEHDSRPLFRILDALSATGLRALRYAKELPFNTKVTANDLSKAAVESIKLNIQHNQLSHRICTSVGNANAHMYSFVGQEGVGGPGQKYHVIDLDPYGTAVPFLDAAVQATADNGLLCVTCTDTSVFNSMGYAEKAFSLYGGLPARGDYCHEVGLRLILNAIATSAARYGIAIEPLVSLSIDYYARVFVRVRKSPADVKFHASKTMIVYACDHGCGAWQSQYHLPILTSRTQRVGVASFSKQRLEYGHARGWRQWLPGFALCSVVGATWQRKRTG